MQPSIAPVDIAWKAAQALTGEGGAPPHKATASSSSSSSSSPLDRVLKQRIQAAYEELSALQLTSPQHHNDDNDDVHAATAEAALVCLDALQRYLSGETSLLGARHRKTLDTLCSLASQWGFAPAVVAYDAERQGGGSQRSAATHLAQLFALCPSSTTGAVQDRILATVLAADLLAAGIRLAFGPKTAASPAAHALVSTWVKQLPPSALLPLLSALLSRSGDSPRIPAFVRQMARRLLSGQLLRSEGVIALVSAVVGERDGSDLDVRALDSLADLLTVPPPGFPAEVFLQRHTLPALLPLVTGGKSTHPGYARAAAYTLARLKAQQEEQLAEQLRPLVWEPLNRSGTSAGDHTLTAAGDISAALDALEMLSLASPPGSDWTKWLLTPVINRLWLLAELSRRAQCGVSEVRSKGKGATQVEAQAVALIQTWLSAASTDEALELVQSLSPRSAGALEEAAQPRAFFDVDEGGGVALQWGQPPARQQPDILSSIPIASSAADDDDAQMQAQARALLESLDSSNGSSIVSASSPSLICRHLSQCRRRDVAARLLPNLLERTLALKRRQRPSGDDDGSASARLFWFLELIVALVDAFGEDLVQHDSQQALLFVHYCLGGSVDVSRDSQGNEIDDAKDGVPLIKAQGKTRGILDELRNLNIDASEGRAQSNPDGNDDEPLDLDLTRTALELLLSTLEAHAELNPRDHPLVAIIDRNLASKRFDEVDDPELSAVVKEARLVLLARKQSAAKKEAEVLTIETPASRVRRQVQEKYQEALKLLQDPIIPVRAHGIVLLKELAAELHARRDQQQGDDDEARRTAINDLVTSSDFVTLLLQAVADDESFLYLHAIQALKDVALGGKDGEHLAHLVRLYAGGGSSSPSPSVAVRLRLGEVLLQTVQALSEAGSKYVDAILPPLLGALRDAKQPTTLRSSVLSLLGTCVEAFPLALCGRHGSRAFSWSQDMAEAALDLLQVEGGKKSTVPAALASEDDDDDDDGAARRRRLNWAPGADDASSTDTSFPQLRRGAVLLLCLLVRGARHQLEDYGDEAAGQVEPELKSLRLPSGASLPALGRVRSPSSPPALLFPATLTKRTSMLAGWLHSADEDAVVRHQAQDLKTECEALDIALLQFGGGFGVGGR